VLFRTDGTAVVAAVNIGTSPELGSEAHLVDWGGGTPTVMASADLFPEDMAIMGGTAISRMGTTLFVGDTSGFSSAPNSVVIANIDGSTFGEKQRIDIEDPFAIVADPDRQQTLVASGFGDAVFVLDKPTTAWRSREVTYVGGKPQLPSGMTLINAGSLRGRILLAELSGVRQLRFTDTGVEDLGRFTIGMEIEDSTGAIGVTP
jgi:DNA-binding beta-propeller fold protein YncE